MDLEKACVSGSWSVYTELTAFYHVFEMPDEKVNGQ